MGCGKYRKILGAYRDGELAPQVAGEVSEHLAHCPECRGLTRHFGRLGELVRATSTARAPLGFEASFWARAETSGRPAEAPREAWFTRPRRLALAGAGAAALAALLLWSPVQHGGPAVPTIVLAETTPVAVADWSRLAGSLGDEKAGGLFDTDSIEVPADWGPGTRIEGFRTQESAGGPVLRYVVGEVSDGSRLQRVSF